MTDILSLLDFCSYYSWYLKVYSHGSYFSDCDCDSSCRNTWVVEESMELFELCDCTSITNSYVAQYQQKQIAVAIGKNVQCKRSLSDKMRHSHAREIFISTETTICSPSSGTIIENCLSTNNYVNV